jgi:hypothetical protein
VKHIARFLTFALVLLGLFSLWCMPGIVFCVLTKLCQ